MRAIVSIPKNYHSQRMVTLGKLIPELSSIKEKAPVNQKRLEEAIRLVARSHATLVVETLKEKIFISRFFSKKLSKYVDGYIHMTGVRFPILPDMAVKVLIELKVKKFYFQHHKEV